MSSVVLIVPGRLDTPTGGYGYDRRMAAGLRASGWSVEVHELDEGFPHPTQAARARAARVLAAIPPNSTVLVDGLAFGALADEAACEAGRLRLVALVHHPLAAETGLDRDVAAALAAGERRALATARLVVVTSRATASALASYGVDRTRIVVVEPGTDRAPLAGGSHSATVHLLSVAAVIPRKGYDVLLDALTLIADRNWRLTAVGSLERHPETAGRLRAGLREQALDNRVELAGELDASQVTTWYDAADLFVLATLYEGYGMAVAEALAHGLPVISTATGAIPELVGDGAGIVVAPGDAAALAAALSQVLDDPGMRERLAQGARRVRDRLPGWAKAAAKMAQALERAAVDG